MKTLTPLAKVLIYSNVFVFGCLYYGLLSNPFVVAVLLLTLLLVIWVGHLVRNERDIDEVSVFLLNGRGFETPDGARIPPTFQNLVSYIDGDFPPLSEVSAFIERKVWPFDRMRRCSAVPSRHHSATGGWFERSFWNVRLFEAVLGDDIDMEGELVTEVTVEGMEQVYAEVHAFNNSRVALDTPQWRLRLIRNAGDGYSAWAWRISHSIGDGLRLISMACKILEDADGNEPLPPAVGKTKAVHSTEAKLAKAKAKKEKRRMAAKGFVQKRKAFWPSRGPLDWMLQLKNDLEALDKMSTGVFDSVTPFKPDKELTFPKEQVFVRNHDFSIPMPFVKALKAVYECSVNDVLTAAMSGAIRRYNLAMGHVSECNELTRCVVAFGFPNKEPFSSQPNWLRNDLSFVSWRFPVEKERFEDRVADSSRTARAMKSSLQPLLLKYPPKVMVRLGVFDDFLEKTCSETWKRHSLIFSNVPGFTKQVYMFGKRVVKMEASYTNTIPQVILMSYFGFIHATLTLDPTRYESPQLLMDFLSLEIADEFAKLKDDTVECPPQAAEAIAAVRERIKAHGKVASAAAAE